MRASKTVGSATTYFLYDGGEPIVEMNSSGTVTAFNVYAPDGLVSRTAGSTTTEYVFDQQGNVADRTDTSGTVQSVTQYDGWGIEQAISGTPSDPFGYNAQSGYYLDRETGLYLCQHRFYDPANGRWLNRDPIGYGGGTNLYGYCAGGPIGTADYSGLDISKIAVPAIIGQMLADASISDALPAVAGAATAAAVALGSDPNAASDGANLIEAGCDLVSRLSGAGNSNANSAPTPWAPGDPIGPMPGVGDPVYRAFGGAAQQDGRSWTTVPPDSIPNYRGVMGLPNSNSGEWWVKGIIRAVPPGTTWGPAEPLDGNPGGGPEIRFPYDPSGPPVTITGGPFKGSL